MDLFWHHYYLNSMQEKCPCDDHLTLKKEPQYLVQRMKTSFKRDYIKSCLENYRNDPKKPWKVIRDFKPLRKVMLLFLT